MSAYDDFAWFYNRYWNEEFHSLAFPILERIWLSRVAPPGHILDVCCGTGHLAGLLTARGYRVTGIDASASMIEQARENVPQAEFIHCDAAEFRSKTRFDAAVSTFDSLNHIVSLEDFRSAMRRTASTLKAGAPFAFDLLHERAYQTHWGETFALVRDDHVLTITGGGYDFRNRVAQCSLTMFRRMEGAWQRSDSVVQERCYTDEEIGGALAEARLGETVCYDAADLGMAGQLGEGRTFYVVARV
jgi:SAM-dependent methyltransferase